MAHENSHILESDGTGTGTELRRSPLISNGEAEARRDGGSEGAISEASSFDSRSSLKDGAARGVLATPAARRLPARPSASLKTRSAEIESLPTQKVPVPEQVSKTTSGATRSEEIESLPTQKVPVPEQVSRAPLARTRSAEIESLPTRKVSVPEQVIRTNSQQQVSSGANDINKLSTVQASAAGNSDSQQRISATDTERTEAIRPAPPAGPFAFVRHAAQVGLARLQEPQPEGLVTRGLQIVRPTATLGLFPMLSLINAVGLFLVSLSYYLGQVQIYALEAAFLLGLLLIFVPNLLRLLSSSPPRMERMYLLCGIGVAFYAVALMMSPLHISSFDEFLHWVTADNILRTGHLFSDNSMLPVSPYYPGLEIVTNAISSMTGLGTFYASIPLIVASRILMVLALFLFYEKITNSSRMASIATIIYMTNPHFLFFDSMYGYETLALPLALCMLYILARFENVGGGHRWVIFTSWIVLIALTFSHHMTDYVFNGLLLLWALVSFFSSTSRKARLHLVTLATFGCLLMVAYAFLMPGNPVWGYLSSYFATAFTELTRIIEGTSASRPLFTSNGAAPSPVWDRILMLGSVAFVAFSLPFGLLTLLRLYRRNALPLVLGIFALAYPVTQAFRFTTFGPEITDRSSAFLFLAVAYVMTILITHFWPTRGLNKLTIVSLTCILSVVLVGGVILDAGAGFTNLPGSYTVGADARSITEDGVDASLWSLAYLGPNNRVGTDRTDQMLMGTYGGQRVVTQLDDNIDVSPLFYSTKFDANDISLLRQGKVKFLVVDQRLSTAIPVLGFYFVTDEPEANQIKTPISLAALTKFNTVPQINRFFDNGNIVIYDTGAFADGTVSP